MAIEENVRVFVLNIVSYKYILYIHAFTCRCTRFLYTYMM